MKLPSCGSTATTDIRYSKRSHSSKKRPRLFTPIRSITTEAATRDNSKVTKFHWAPVYFLWLILSMPLLPTALIVQHRRSPPPGKKLRPGPDGSLIPRLLRYSSPCRSKFGAACAKTSIPKLTASPTPQPKAHPELKYLADS